MVKNLVFNYKRAKFIGIIEIKSQWFPKQIFQPFVIFVQSAAFCFSTIGQMLPRGKNFWRQKHFLSVLQFFETFSNFAKGTIFSTRTIIPQYPLGIFDANWLTDLTEPQSSYLGNRFQLLARDRSTEICYWSASVDRSGSTKFVFTRTAQIYIWTDVARWRGQYIFILSAYFQNSYAATGN